jgi:hypothetical protein
LRIVPDGLGGWRGETSQQVTHLWEYHRVHDLSAQNGYGSFSGSIGDIDQVAFPLDYDVAYTRMPCQGPAHIQYSQAAEKAIDSESDAAQQVCLIDRCVGGHVHIRSYPHIA